MERPRRRIIHVDMDEFFAAVEKLDHPELRGKCLLIGGDPNRRGVVSTASYEARRYGCHSAMPMSTALRLCPHAVVLAVRGERYRQFSEQVFAILEQFTPLVEPVSIDEAFLDVTGCERLFGPGERIAAEIKRRIDAEVHLTASVGVAPNKFLAKLASDLRKPDGLVVIDEAEVEGVLSGLPIEKVWGMGPAGARQLHKLGVRTIGELRRRPKEQLVARFGKAAGEHYLRLARGLDDREVIPDSEAKSISQERTFAVDVSEPAELERVLSQQVEQVARRLRRSGQAARTVSLKLRVGDFTTHSRSRTLDRATDVTDELRRAALDLLRTWAGRGVRPLRLIGFAAHRLVPAGGGQLSLFDQADRDRLRRLDRAVDEIVSRFGENVILRGSPGGRGGKQAPDRSVSRE